MAIGIFGIIISSLLFIGMILFLIVGIREEDCHHWIIYSTGVMLVCAGLMTASIFTVHECADVYERTVEITTIYNSTYYLVNFKDGEELYLTYNEKGKNQPDKVKIEYCKISVVDSDYKLVINKEYGHEHADYYFYIPENSYNYYTVD